MHTVGLHRPTLHVQVPDFYVQVVARAQVAPGMTEFNVGNAAYDFGEEVLGRRVFALLEYFGLIVAQRRLTHVAQAYDALAAAVDEQVALFRMKLGRRDHLVQLLHVGRLYVDDVEALLGDLEVPQVDAQVVGRHESFLVAVQRY